MEASFNMRDTVWQPDLKVKGPFRADASKPRITIKIRIKITSREPNPKIWTCAHQMIRKKGCGQRRGGVITILPRSEKNGFRFGFDPLLEQLKIENRP